MNTAFGLIETTGVTAISNLEDRVRLLGVTTSEGLVEFTTDLESGFLEEFGSTVEFLIERVVALEAAALRLQQISAAAIPDPEEVNTPGFVLPSPIPLDPDQVLEGETNNPIVSPVTIPIDPDQFLEGEFNTPMRARSEGSISINVDIHDNSIGDEEDAQRVAQLTSSELLKAIRGTGFVGFNVPIT